MSDEIAEARVESTFEVEIIYNGLDKRFKVRPEETVLQLREQAVRTFNAQQGHLLALYTAAGVELVNEAQTIREAGVHPRDKLILRPSAVRGG